MAHFMLKAQERSRQTVSRSEIVRRLAHRIVLRNAWKRSRVLLQRTLARMGAVRKVSQRRKGINTSTNFTLDTPMSRSFFHVRTSQKPNGPQPSREAIIESRSKSSRVILNVGGDRHEVLWRTLGKVPHSRLGRLQNAVTHQDIIELCDDYNIETNEYFFDRHPQTFGCVLNMYRTGHLHAMDDICVLAYHSDLIYWGIEDHNMDPCCLSKYYRKKEHVEDEIKKVNEIFIQQMDEEYFGEDKCAGYRKKLWDMLEKPQTSTAARVSHLCNILTYFTVDKSLLAKD